MMYCVQRFPFLFTFFLTGGLVLLNAANADLAPENVSAIARQFMQRNAAPGLVIGIYNRGKEKIYTFGVSDVKNQHPLDENTLLEIGSITKVFNATILGNVLNRQIVQVDQSIGNFLPSPLRKKNYAVDSITFRQLATHTSALPAVPGNYRPEGYTLQDMFRFLQKWQPRWVPGTRYKYSNLGFGVLGLTLQQIYQKPFALIVKQQILNPLGMNRTFEKIPPYVNNIATGYGADGKAVPPFPMAPWRPGAGAIRSSGHDMMLFLKANLLTMEIPRELQLAIKKTHDSYFQKNRHGFVGLGWEIQERTDGLRILAKGGRTNGFTSYIIFVPEQQTGLFIMTNKRGMQIKKLAHALLMRLLESSVGHTQQ